MLDFAIFWRPLAIFFSGACLIASGALTTATAAPVTIPFSLIANATPGAAIDPAAPLEQRLAALLRRQFDALGLNVNSGVIVDSIDIAAHQEQLSTSCPIPVPKEIRTEPATAAITVAPESSVSLNLDDLSNMSIALNLAGTIDMLTNAQVVWGQTIPFGASCKTIGTDSGVLHVSSPFMMDLTMTVAVDPSFDSARVAFVLDKKAQVTGNLHVQDGKVDPDFGRVSLTDAVINGFERYLLTALHESTMARAAERIQKINWRLDGRNDQGNLDPSIVRFNGPSVFPLVRDGGDSALTQLVLAELDLPNRVIAALKSRGGELLLQVLVLDSEQRKAILTKLAFDVGCDTLKSRFAQNLPRIPLYTMTSASCAAVDTTNMIEGNYFSDANCKQALAYRPTDDQQWCRAQLDPASGKTLGNAAAWTPDTNQPNDPLPKTSSRAWTNLLSTRLDLGAVSLSALHDPYVKQVNFKTIAEPRPGVGTCQLEMRVYKEDIAARNLKPLIAIHGGTWRNRGVSFLGLEASIAQFTSRGFIVFAPFYRLVGDSDGNTECNQATWREVTDDVNDALLWVNQNGSALGASTGPVEVFGQSAGAQLSAWLATHNPAQVKRALLFYPPLDVLAFLKDAIPVGGRYADFREFGMRSLAEFFGAQNGGGDVRFDRLLLMSVDSNNPGTDLSAAIPDDTFDLTQLNLTTPPLYVAKCASETKLDLAGIDPALPPPALVQCLKHSLSDFLLQNSFDHQVRGQSVRYDIVQGGADTLVPYPQAIELCNALDGGTRPTTLVGDHEILTCGSVNETHIISGAQHALDLGLCIGTICPAGMVGTPTRVAVQSAVAHGYDWLAANEPPPQEVTIPPVATSTPTTPKPGTTRQPIDSAAKTSQTVASNGGGGVWEIWLVALLAVSRHRVRVTRKDGSRLSPG